jgi:hypothetical protein
MKELSKNASKKEMRGTEGGQRGAEQGRYGQIRQQRRTRKKIIRQKGSKQENEVRNL